MKIAILDTDILSYVLDRKHSEVTAQARQYLRVFRRFSVSTLTLAESIQGIVKKPRYPDELAAFMKESETFEVFPLYREEATLAGHILGQLLRTGQQIGPHDPFIAATAIENDRVLITNNSGHYQRIIDLGFPLEIENWRETGG